MANSAAAAIARQKRNGSRAAGGGRRGAESERAELAWRLVAFGCAADASAEELFDRLDPFMSAFPFASRVPAGNGVLLRLAAAETPDSETLARIDRAFGLGAADALRYDDATRSVGRRIALEGKQIRAVRLSGDTRSERWLQDYWSRGAAVDEVRRYLAMPIAAPPGDAGANAAGARKMVCVCHDVTEDAIVRAIGRGSDTLPALQQELKCGSNCGSCIPEVRGLLGASKVAASAQRYNY